MTETDLPMSYPRLKARTLSFTLGVPREFTISSDRSRVAFLRSRGGTDRAACLWVADIVEEGLLERVVADPHELLDGGQERLSPAERARRERAREGGAGIISYATDEAGTRAAFALSGRLFVTDLLTGQCRDLDVTGPVIDPRPDPTGEWVAFVADGALRVVPFTGGPERVLAAPDGEQITWGLAEFVAAEEMDRDRGYWWAPDGRSLLVQRTDESPVTVWHIADPAHPALPPASVRYPAAGGDDAEVTLWLVDLDGARREVSWDRTALPYLTRVSWTSYGDPLVQVMSRDQRRAVVLAVDAASATSYQVHEASDDTWLDLVAGVPCWTPKGALLTTVDADGCRRLAADGVAFSPVGVQVRAVAGVDGTGALVTASTEPTEIVLARIGWDGEVTGLAESPGVHTGLVRDDVAIVSSRTLEHDEVDTRVVRLGPDGGMRELGRLASLAATCPLTPAVRLMRVGTRALRTAVLLPTGHVPGSRRLPVLMDPYGGPHAQRVLSARAVFRDSQWLADQGFAVVVVDGRGTPGRGPAWERAVHHELAEVTLADQVDALAAVVKELPDDLDASRVGIRGWSYGGYLAALAVLRRPDVFHAAVAGAPVTDWRLYDTFYTERYLGHPDVTGEVYDRNSLLADAPRLRRPLMIVHGLADDNVVAAHTLRLSSALLAAGRAHTVLPLSGVTHMTPQEVVAENLLHLQVSFLREALAQPATP
ncbi:MAG TPA: prolyl oligopeptidase family serine peptidase [Actinomycetes bacterium]|nr:prolyl oligopeptidase family serine peptidase [Actinomycetes bacterium]